jgi:hypothetical protein
MDNVIADRLAALLAEAGLRDVTVTPQHEVARRGGPEWALRAGIWAQVAATRGHQMVADGAIAEAERWAAEVEYREWVRAGGEAHTQYLLAAEGVKPT